MSGYLSSVLLVSVFLLSTPSIGLVSGNFLLFVRFINYTNPSGLCAECVTEIGNGDNQTASALNVTPVCCDEGDKTDNCTTTGPLSCDTRFRWNLRPYGSTLETRPVTIPNANNPPYHFTDCNLPGSECPFSEVSRMFDEGVTGFLGVDENPLQVDTSRPREPQLFNNWPGRVQFYIEAIHMGVPNVIDSFLVDLDDLVLGNPEFTNEATYVGFHNISYMRMGFRVECAPGYCGGNCSINNTTNPRVGTCATSIVCVNDRLDPEDECNSCFNNLDFDTLCNTCVQPNYNPATNCTTCLPGYNNGNNCSSCSEINYDPATNCTTCQDGYDMSTNCSLCTVGELNHNDNCAVCIKEGFDPSTNCTQCIGNRTALSNCTQCMANRNLSTDCTTCNVGWDIATGCTTCSPGYEGDACVFISSGTGLDRSSVAAIGGGVGGALLLVIVILLVVVCVLVCQVRRRGSAKFNNVSDNAPANAYNLESRENTGTGTSEEHKFKNPIYGPGQEPKLVAHSEVSPEHMFANSMYETARVPRRDDYSQLQRPSSSPPSHTVKTGTNDFSQKEGTPVYDRADSHNMGFSKESTPQQEDYARLRHPTETSITLQPVPAPPEMFTAPVFDDDQPVYDEAYPSTANHVTGEPRQRHPSKSRAAYEEIDDDMSKDKSPKSSDYDKAYPTPNQQQYDDIINPNFEQPAYDTIADPGLIAADVYDSPDFSSVQTTNGPSGNGHYDKANRHPGSHTTLPLTEAFYDTANFNTKPAATLTYDYADTFPTKTPPPSLSTMKSHPYDEVATEEGASELSLSVRPAYSNTTPGAINPLAETHYDMGP